MSAATVVQRPIQRAARPARPIRAVRPVGRVHRRPNYALRRIAALLTVLLVIVGLGALWTLRSDAAPGDVVEATVVVAPGQTVWDIASDYAPEGQHPQAYVAEVLRYNHLEAASVAPGTALRLPRP